MDIEQRLLAYFRAMDHEAKKYVLSIAEGQAEMWPANKATSLRLVASNDFRNGPFGGSLSRIGNIGPTPLGGPPKKVK